MMGRGVGGAGFAAVVAFVAVAVEVEAVAVEVAGLVVAAFAVSAEAAVDAARLVGRRAAGQRGADGCAGGDAGIYFAEEDGEDCMLKGPGCCTLGGESDTGSRKSRCWACRRMGGEGGDRGWSCCWTASFGEFAQDIAVVAAVVAAEGDKAVKKGLVEKLDRLAAVLDCAGPGSISRLA